MKKKTFLTRIVLSASALILTVLITSCAEILEVAFEDNKEGVQKMLRLDNPGARSDMSVQQLIDAMQKAIDPDKKFYNAEKYLLRQQIITEQESKSGRVSQVYVMDIRYAKPDKIRWTYYRNGIPFKISVCRDGDAWNIDPDNKKVTKVPEGLGLNLFRTSTAMANPTKTYLDIFKTVEIASVYEDGKRCYRLVCQAFDERIAPYVFYVDAETYLPVKTQTIVYHDSGTKSLYTSAPQDYKWFDNSVRQPVRTIVKTGDQKQDVVTILEFKLNPNIPDSAFELPKPFQVE